MRRYGSITEPGLQRKPGFRYQRPPRETKRDLRHPSCVLCLTSAKTSMMTGAWVALQLGQPLLGRLLHVAVRIAIGHGSKRLPIRQAFDGGLADVHFVVLPGDTAQHRLVS